jgi:hypothetical protein
MLRERLEFVAPSKLADAADLAPIVSSRDAESRGRSPAECLGHLVCLIMINNDCITCPNNDIAVSCR